VFNLGAPEIVAILVIALIVLGPKRLPEVGKSLGKAASEFRQALASTPINHHQSLGESEGHEDEEAENGSDSSRLS